MEPASLGEAYGKAGEVGKVGGGHMVWGGGSLVEEEVR